MKNYQILISFIIVSQIITSCGPSESEIATANAQTQSVIDNHATEVEGTQEANQATEDAMSTSAAETTSQAATTTKSIEITATIAAEKTATEEATIVAATAIASSLYDQVMELAASGAISHTGGTYYLLPDFEKEEDQDESIRIWDTGYSPVNFVLRADIISKDLPKEQILDCGIYFREQDNVNAYTNAYMAFFGAGAAFIRFYNGQIDHLGVETQALEEGEIEVDFMLVVEDSLFYVFVNGDQLFRAYDAALTSGKLSFFSYGDGNRCQIKNIELWILD